MKLTDEDRAAIIAAWSSAWNSGPIETTRIGPMLQVCANQTYLAGKRAGALAMREWADRAVADEPECPGEMPDEMWMAIRGDRTVAMEAVRLTVRVTKRGIRGRIRALEVDDE